MCLISECYVITQINMILGGILNDEILDSTVTRNL